MRRVGFPDSDMQKWTVANDDLQNPRITQAMQKYVENFPELRKKGQGLLLYGTVGTGKTYAAAEVANALIDKGYSALVTNFARIANTVGGMYGGKQDYYDSLNRFDLLVIDDLAAERKTEYMQEIVYNVIDSRYRAGLPMIITTNLTAEELKNPQDITNKRIFDRVMERCHPVLVEGINRRHKKVKEEFAGINDLLGL
jgi:DNA replication protein DnaC